MPVLFTQQRGYEKRWPYLFRKKVNLLMSSQRISVIIAAYNVENFIQAAVNSAIEQSIPFHEIIIVNDCATDDTPRLVEALVQGHPNVHVINCPNNIGLGEVRNLGTAQATGDYIAYLDGDDVFTSNAHEIMQRAIATGPDMAILNHTRFYDDGGFGVNRKAACLDTGLHRTADEKIALFENLNVAWNKIYKRSFLTGAGLTFPRGKYEDIAWNYLAVIKADTIATSPEVIVQYRQREGSILRSRNDTHFDIFDRWDELWNALEADPELMDVYGPSLTLRRFKSLVTVLDADRLPPASKSRFADKIREVCQPANTLHRSQIGISDMLLGYRFGYQPRRLLRTKAYLKLRKRVRALPGKIKLGIYRQVFLRLPIDQKAIIYQSYWGKKVACNPYAIFTHLLDTAPGQYHHFWVVREGVDLRRSAGTAKHLRENSLAYLYYMARARHFITNANFPTHIEKRLGTAHVQTKHGTPLKFMGIDILSKDPEGLGNKRAFAKRSRRWDYVISSNPYSSQIWRQGFPYNYKVLETGYPRNDRLITAPDAERVALRAQFNLPLDKKVVLYAPTFRPEYDPALAADLPDKEEIISAIMAGLPSDCVLAIRDHYFLDPDSAWADDPRLVDLSSHASTTDVLLVTDMLITDYSSIMFDFATQKRPIIVLGYDKALYEDARGMYFDIATEHPGVYCHDLDQLTIALRDNHADTPDARDRLDAFHARFCPWEDGQASARVCDLLFNQTL